MRKYLFLISIVFSLLNCKKEDTTPIVSPLSGFTYSIDPSTYRSVQFQNASHYITTGSKYLWTFGDGETSTEENPKYDFKTDGVFEVVLKVTNGSLSDCSTKSVIIASEIPDSTIEIPQVQFTYSQNGKSFFFQNSSSNTISKATYIWNYGDGSAYGTTEDASHVYSNEGIYNVVLKVTQKEKTYSFAKPIYVTSSLYPAYDTLKPVPSFVYNYKGNTVYFTNTSSFTSDGTSYTWTFGDGSPVDIRDSPNHEYADGSYNVILKVKNSKYTVTYSTTIIVPNKPIDVIDSSIKPTAKFVYSQIAKQVFFENASSNTTPNTTYSWHLGDSQSLTTIENPFHIYTTSGKYMVVLKVTTGNVSDSYSAEVDIP